MGYIKKSLQEINRILDEERELPKYWNKFIEESSKSENILIKSAKNHLYCTNCQKEYKYITPPKKTSICPFCHQNLEVKNWNIKKVEYKKNLILVDNVNDNYVLRLFELCSIYQNKEWERSVVEFGRHFLKEDKDVIKENVCTAMGSFYVSHGLAKYSINKWRAVDSYWRRLSKCGKVYHYNLKELFKGTKYQYSQLWDLAKNMEWLDMAKILRYEINRTCFELLIKAKLYNLACESSKFDKSGSFENRFGISKEFYPFMKKHNINCKELERLKILKQQNIRKIRYLTIYSVDLLEEIQKYINLDKFIMYSKKIKNFDEYTYRDYLRFCKHLGFNMKDKQVLFPRTKKELDKKHDELEKQYEIKKDEVINESIKKRYEELKKNIFHDNQFIITPAATINSLIDESKQQNNCVRTYAEKYSNGECDIYFARLLKCPENSLITVEVRDNKIVQSRLKNNKPVEENQEKWLNDWCQNILNKAV